MTRSPRVFSRFGALDSAALADGRASDAQVLRTLAMSANRLATRGQPLAQVVFNSIDESEAINSANGWHKGFAPPFWLQITPTIPIVKKPLIRSAKLFWRIAASTGDLGVQVATDASPFNPRARATLTSNTFGFAGSGVDPYGEVANVHRGIALREGPTENVTFYIRGSTGADGDTGTYGTPNTGTITKVSGQRDVLEVEDAEWNIGGWNTGGHAVIITPATGTSPIEPRWITSVFGENFASTDGTKLKIFPALPDDATVEAVVDAEFTIVKIPQWRVYGLSLYAEARDV
jgi:hypothetical protein